MSVNPARIVSANTVVERNRRDFRRVLSQCALSISQVGYNTTLDILASRTKAVLVPFRSDTQREQSLRAALLDDAGLAVAVTGGDNLPGQLAQAMDRAHELKLSTAQWMLDGATTSATCVHDNIVRRLALTSGGMSGG